MLDIFGSVPESDRPLSIDVRAVISLSPYQERVFKTVRKSVQQVNQDGTLSEVPPADEYTFFDECVYLIIHIYTIVEGPKKSEVFIWVGSSSSGDTIEQAQGSAKKLAKENGNAFVSSVRQGLEPSGFLQALGGILVTRRGSREAATKQYMLCGRKHLGQIVFDEVDFGPDSLCSGFAYLISYPVTLQETRLYLWKGSCCSIEETSGARLAAMDLSETGEIIEVDDGAEFSSFLKIFGPGTTKSSIPKASDLWQQKALRPSNFVSRLFRLQQAETKSGIFASMFKRRPSSNNGLPARKQSEDIKIEAKEVSPFTQSDLEAECIYLLDAYHKLYLLVGPMFPSQPKHIRDALLAQTLPFASEYTNIAPSMEERPVLKGFVLFSGISPDMKMLFRHWDDDHGLWGTAGLMAGSQANSKEATKIIALDDVLRVVCKS